MSNEGIKRRYRSHGDLHRGKMTLGEFCTRFAGCPVSAFTGHCHMFYVRAADLRGSILRYLRNIGLSEMFKVKVCLQEGDVRVDALTHQSDTVYPWIG